MGKGSAATSELDRLVRLMDTSWRAMAEAQPPGPVAVGYLWRAQRSVLVPHALGGLDCRVLIDGHVYRGRALSTVECEVSVHRVHVRASTELTDVSRLVYRWQWQSVDYAMTASEYGMLHDVLPRQVAGAVLAFDVVTREMLAKARW